MKNYGHDVCSLLLNGLLWRNVSLFESREKCSLPYCFDFSVGSKIL